MPDELKRRAPLLLSFSCPVKWESMEGDANVRSCDQCACKVQNITDYSEAQVNELLARVDAGEPVCVSFRIPATSADCKAPARIHEQETEVRNWPEPTLFLARELVDNPPPRELARFSIALAASFGLTCYFPVGYAPAFGQTPKSVASKKLNTTDARETCIDQRATPKEKITSEAIKIAPEDHGMWGGRPASSNIRDIVNEIAFCFGNQIDSSQVKPQIEAFTKDLDHGEISPHKVEALADAFAKHGSAGKARRCYELLVALSDREPSGRTHLRDWQDRYHKLGAREFGEEIAKFDHELHANQPSLALNHLSAANNVRNTDPAVAAKFPWSEISRRLDTVQPKLSLMHRYRFLDLAIKMAAEENTSPGLKQWIQSKRISALTLFKQAVAAADNATKKGNYVEAYNKLNYACQIGSIDEEIEARCDWLGIDQRFSTLISVLPPEYQSMSSERASRSAHKGQPEQDGK